jgi:hypothetical protein
MKINWLFVAALFPVLSFAQDKSPVSSLNTVVSLGMAAGESAAKPLVQVASGLYYDRHYVGLGIGVDQYNFKSIPLFADWKLGVGKSRLAFLYLDGGYNFPYDNSSKHSNGVDFFKTSDEFSGGLYVDAGLGYRIRLNSSDRLLISAGYSQKNISNSIGYTYPCWSPPCIEEIYKYHYNLGRIMAKLSWEFGRRR